jgi:hypothetical protein
MVGYAVSTRLQGESYKGKIYVKSRTSLSSVHEYNAEEGKSLEIRK